jgi:hypothetical protein
MVVFLSYNFSTLLLMENSRAKISGCSSMFKSVQTPYVFTIVFLSYPMYSHDFSCFSLNIIFYRLENHIWVEEELGSRHFPRRCVW